MRLEFGSLKPAHIVGFRVVVFLWSPCYCFVLSRKRDFLRSVFSTLGIRGKSQLHVSPVFTDEKMSCSGANPRAVSTAVLLFLGVSAGSILLLPVHALNTASFQGQFTFTSPVSVAAGGTQTSTGHIHCTSCSGTVQTSIIEVGSLIASVISSVVPISGGTPQPFTLMQVFTASSIGRPSHLLLLFSVLLLPLTAARLRTALL